MQKIRIILFGFFAIIGAIFFIIGAIFLNRKQARKLTILLEEVIEAVQDWKTEPTTLEDKLFLEDTRLTQDMYKRGTNKDLSIECRICGENTTRGKYFVRKDGDTDPDTPYNFICKDCWNELPSDYEDWISSHWLFDSLYKGGEINDGK